jgi:DNA-binding NtrC family response regulator
MSDRRIVLTIDEDPAFRRNATRFLSERGFIAHEADGPDSGLAATLRHRPDFVLVDVHMKAAPGVDLIETLAQSQDPPKVIGVTGSSRVPEVVAAIKAGAVDVLERPVDGERLLAIIQEILAVSEAMQGRGERPRPVSLPGSMEVDVLVSESPVMKQLLQDLMRRAGEEESIVLIGEEGLRLDAVARFAHRMGPRAEGPLVIVARTDAEERLFGSARQSSAFADAKGGVVFIESLASLGAAGQERLVKLMQGLTGSASNGAVRWPPMIIGSELPIGVQVRRNLVRPDLGRLLEPHSVTVPPLRQRRADVPVLIHRVVSAIESLVQPKTVRVDGKVVDALVGREWPGNVDELVATVRNAACLSDEGELFLDLTARPEVALPRVEPNAPAVVPEPEPSQAGWTPTLDASGQVQPYDVYEAEIFRFALQNAGGCVSRAAELLGVGRATMYRKMKAYDIDVPPVSERAISRSRRSRRSSFASSSST